MKILRKVLKVVAFLVVVAPMTLFAIVFTWFNYEHGAPDPGAWTTIGIVWLGAAAVTLGAAILVSSGERPAERSAHTRYYDRR